MVNYQKICDTYKAQNKNRPIFVHEYLRAVGKEFKNRNDEVLLSGLEITHGNMALNPEMVIDLLYDTAINKMSNTIDPSGALQQSIEMMYPFLSKVQYAGGTTYPANTVDSFCKEAFAYASSDSNASIQHVVHGCETQVHMLLHAYCQKGNGIGYIKFKMTVKLGICIFLLSLSKDMLTYHGLGDTIELQSSYRVKHPPNSLKWFCYMQDIRDRKILKNLEEDKYPDLYNRLWEAKETGTNPLLSTEDLLILSKIVEELK